MVQFLPLVILKLAMKQFIKKAPHSLIVAAGLGLLAVMSPFLFDAAMISLFTKILIFGLFAMSLDLLVGYTALWSFGHAAFFGIAGYSTGILITRFDISSFWITLPATILIVFIFSAIYGFISLRVSGTYFLLVTLALGEITYHTSVALYDWTGGETGLASIPYPSFIDSSEGIYYFVLAICLACFAFLHFLVKSPFGQSLKGIREDETRMKCLGYNVWLHKYIAFIVAGLFAGISGVLYAHYNGVIVTYDVGLVASGLPWLMLIIGGAGTLWGSLIGSAVVFFLEYFTSSLTPGRWPLIEGAIFVIVIMAARQGILVWIRQMGILVWIRDFIKKRKR
jgi:branched-chain amino acid transport system permease protein